LAMTTPQIRWHA